jgi:hypothetical protein
MQQRITVETTNLAKAINDGTTKTLWVIYHDKKAYHEEFADQTMPMDFTSDTTIAGIRRHLFAKYGFPVCRCFYLTLKGKRIAGGTVSEHDITDWCSLRLEHNTGVPCSCRG